MTTIPSLSPTTPARMPERYTANEVRVVAAARAMLLAGGPLPPPRLAAVSWCSVRQLEIDFELVLGTSPRAFADSIKPGLHTGLLTAAPEVARAISAAGFRNMRGYLQRGDPLPGTCASGPRRDETEAEFGWTVLSTEIGEVVAVAADHGLVSVRVLAEAGPELPAQLAEEFPDIRLHRADDALAHVRAVLGALAAGRTHQSQLPTDVPHTDFQARVWRALHRIPVSATRSYSQVACEVGAPKAVRAVGRACATNPVALIVPCHRVVRTDGQLGGYRWGVSIKARLLEMERNRAAASHLEPVSSQ